MYIIITSHELHILFCSTTFSNNHIKLYVLVTQTKKKPHEMKCLSFTNNYNHYVLKSLFLCSCFSKEGSPIVNKHYRVSLSY